MAATVLPVTKLSRTPTTDPAGQAADAVNNNVVANSGRTVIRVKNSDAASHNITFVTPGSQDGLALADDGPHAIAASAVEYFSGYDTPTFGAQMTIICDSALLLLTAFEG